MSNTVHVANKIDYDKTKNGYATYGTSDKSPIFLQQFKSTDGLGCMRVEIFGKPGIYYLKPNFAYNPTFEDGDIYPGTLKFTTDADGFVVGLNIVVDDGYILGILQTKSVSFTEEGLSLKGKPLLPKLPSSVGGSSPKTKTNRSCWRATGRKVVCRDGKTRAMFEHPDKPGERRIRRMRKNKLGNVRATYVTP